MYGKLRIDVYQAITLIAIALFVIVFLCVLRVFGVSDPNPGIQADRVLGQSTFVGGTSNSPSSAVGMYGPEAVCVRSDRVIVADASNHRVLIWNTGNPSNGSQADIVLGQANFTSTTANRGVTATTNTLNYPISVACDSSRIYVSDQGNNRILIWNTLTPESGANADIVLGQADFVSTSTNRGGSVGQNTLKSPRGIFSDGTKLYVGDYSNYRVLIWNSITGVNGQAADIVIGQQDFTTAVNFSGNFTTSTRFGTPASVASDGSKIYVVDSANHRVLIWNTTSPINGQAASIVLGQDDFTGYAANKSVGGPVTSSTLNTPSSVYSDGNNIFVGDDGNKRLLIWTTTTPQNGSGANAILGKSIFTDSSTYDINTSTLTSVGHTISFTSPYLYVPNMNTNRVLRFDMSAVTPSAPTFTSVSTSTVTITSVGSGTNFSFAQYALFDSITGQYLSAAGTLTDSSYWTASSTWPTIAVSGLTPGQGYAFKAMARYISELHSSSSSASNVYTLSNPAGTPTIGTPTSSTLPISWSSNGNSGMTTYAIFNTSTGSYIDATGVATSTPVYQTTSTWSSISATGLSPNTSHQFAIIARNGSGNTDAATSSLSDATYTLANIAGTPTTTVSSSSAIAITFDTNSNPAATTYAIYNVTSGNYVAASGASSASAVYQTSSSWNGISATGLTANTAYQFAVIARNGSNVSSATSTTSTTTYTLTNTPSSVSASAGSTSIVLSWSGDGTQYYAENVTASANSGWISTTQTTFSGLTCNTSYTLRVKAKNGADVETSFASVTATTASCGGGGGGIVISPLLLPSNAVVINQGQKETTSSVITLTLNASDVKDIAIANTPDFAFSSFIPYKSTVSWTLPPGYGTKTVYVKFRSKNGSVSSMSQSIVVEEKSKNVPIVSPHATGEPVAEVKKTDVITEKNTNNNCTLQPHKPYKVRTTNDVWYVTEQCTRRPIKNKDIYFSYFSSWKDIQIVSKDQLASVPKDALVELPLGERYRPPHGTFVQVPEDKAIYYVLGNKKITLGSELMFTQLGYKKEWIELVDKKILDTYEAFKTVTSTENHLDLTLIKYPSSPKVYILEYGKKRHITSESVLFHNRPFRFDRIITIRDTEIYHDGEPIK